MRHQIWIDRGGTFTDCVLFEPKTGEKRIAKVLSSDDAPLCGIRQLLDLEEDAPIPPCDIRMGTTVATNALLERTGAKTALVITRGFGDILKIGDQTRPDLFALRIERPPPLATMVVEINARLDPQGNELDIPSDEELTDIALQLSAERVESVALVVLHAYANPAWERALRDRLRAAFAQSNPPSIVASTEATNQIGLLGRSSTTVVDAYLTPILGAYFHHFEQALGASRLLIMQSSGGLADASRFRGAESLLSGPAGGAVAAALIARKVQSETLVTFDMGGTSTDVSLIQGAPSHRYETILAGINVHAKMMDIHSIAAGGGSECGFDGYGLTVGPKSVGAQPGPICYGKQKDALLSGRERLSLTDINLLLGRVFDDHFPFPLDRAGSLIGLERLTELVNANSRHEVAPREVAVGLFAVATTKMAEAIRTVAAARGVDLRGADLLAFGGASGQHACAIASALGLRRIFVHRLSGVLSAVGIGSAPVSWSGQRDAGQRLLTSEVDREITAFLDELEREGRAHLTKEARSNPTWSLSFERSVSLRYRGTESSLPVVWSASAEVRSSFEAEHEKRFGFRRESDEVQVVSVRLDLHLIPPESGLFSRPPPAQTGAPRALRCAPLVLASGDEREVPVFELSSLAGNHPVHGPAVLLDTTGTFVLEEGFVARLEGELLSVERLETSASPTNTEDLTGVAATQIMVHRFSSLAEQMGEALRRTASSTNIRDRLDFSCALFDHEGNLVAHAPHVPVHLGAMSETVKSIIKLHPEMFPGDAYVSNDPSLGGSHLPDITVVTPVFDQAKKIAAFTASRGHHADVGGISPGSMPAHSTHIEEEGIVLSGIHLVRAGVFQEDALRALLGAPPFPARKVEENLADLTAQLAANRLGERIFASICQETSAEFVTHSMRSVRQLSARWMQDALARLPDESMTFRDCLDDGTPICLRIDKVENGIRLDFTGTGAEHPGNLNAPRAVTLACVLYALRTFLDRPVPLNQGCLDPVQIALEPASLLDPSVGRAVAAGNVETSQRLVDVVLGALGLVAASQGTMNNLSFGTEEFGYYETIAGGSGAGPTFDGESGVHTHMTNTRITDPELLETRFPVRLVEFSLRHGSGGAGRYRGGDGIVREIEALLPLELSILSSRRTTAPFGLVGGAPGACGRNLVAGVPVPSHYSGRLEVGQRVRIETPGGGGYGAGSAPSASTAGAPDSSAGV